MIRRIRLRKSGTGVTNAAFRLHLYLSLADRHKWRQRCWLADSATNYVGAFYVTVDKAFSDGAAGNGAPLIGSEINFTANTYYGLLEGRRRIYPAHAEVFNLLLEVIQN